MTDILHLDYETASEINIKTAGMHVYAAHRSTRILMLGWAFNDEPVQLWEPHKQFMPPPRLIEGLMEPSVLVEAANAGFERLITYYKLGISIAYERMRCTLVRAYYLGFAGSLDMILEQIGLQRKDPRGGQLINKFCSPAAKTHKADWYDWRNAPEDWQAFCEYCIRDVEVERALGHWLDQYPGIPPWDWEQWFIDQRINDRGVPVDSEFASAAINIWHKERNALTEQLKQMTGLPLVTPGPFKDHINQYLERPLTTLRKDDIASRRLHDNLPPYVDGALDIWAQKEAKAATKYAAVGNCVSEDGRARGMFQYKGASRTDRVGGRRLQLQNLKRPIANNSEQIDQIVDAVKRMDIEGLKDVTKTGVSEALGSSVRHVICAPPGKVLTVADWSSIESVVVGWLTYCDGINTIFRSGKDSYKVFATEYYGIPYDQVTKDQRTFCKPPVLGCSYRLGWIGLIKYAEGMGVMMSEDEARRAVETFRRMYPEIVGLWYWLDDVLAYVTISGASVEGYHLRIERDAEFLRIVLPSGRALSYFKPLIIKTPAPWDPEKLIDNFSYMGMDEKRKWLRITAHAGGVTENIVQSIASDILWMGISRAYHAGLDVILHVHDEPVVESFEEFAPAELELLKHLMTQPPSWAPDLWLGAAGFITKRYTKD
jgi:DNA polymerase